MGSDGKCSLHPIDIVFYLLASYLAFFYMPGADSRVPFLPTTIRLD